MEKKKCLTFVKIKRWMSCRSHKRLLLLLSVFFLCLNGVVARAILASTKVNLNIFSTRHWDFDDFFHKPVFYTNTCLLIDLLANHQAFN